MALAFPDVYEIGMSHLGTRILYGILNGLPGVAAERVFCPWPDMRGQMERAGLPLASLETDTPLARFDVVGFSLQYELTFTNILTMLHMSGIPLRSSDRKRGDPLVIAGGPVVFNAEPIAEFFDAILLGDAEEMLPEFLDAYARLRDGGAGRPEVLRELARLEGIYVPSLYATEPEPVTGLEIPVPAGDAPFPVRRRILLDLDSHPFPERIVVPYGEIVHDRISAEIMRGCPVGCRFCQAGYVYRPKRERDPEAIRRLVEDSVAATGYDEFSLSSLNSGAYGAIQQLVTRVMDALEPAKVAVSLSSLHATSLTAELAEQIRRVRKTGFTIAPEGGTQRIRDVINKNLTEEQILHAVRHAFTAGWEDMKLYFMIGLPSETDDDIEGIVELARAIVQEGRKARGRKIEAALSASSFVPKAWTPFQWCGMDRVENLRRKQDLLRSLLPRQIRFKYHPVDVSLMEGVFSRGDRRLSRVIERAWRAGCQFDGWTELYRHAVWTSAFAEEGLDPSLYAHREIDPSSRLPWDITDALVRKQFLAAELGRALVGGAGHTLAPCGPSVCHACGPFAGECVSGVVARTTGRSLPEARAPLPDAPGTPPAGLDTPRGPAERPPAARYWARFAKEGRLRFLSHLDLVRAVVRTFSRAGVPIAYSQGYHPKPRIAFGPALPVGVASRSEYVDFLTREPIDTEGFIRTVSAAAPEGLRFLEARRVHASEPSLQEAINLAVYRITFPRAETATRLLERHAEAKRAGRLAVERGRGGRTAIVEVDPGRVEIAPGGEAGVVLTIGLGQGMSVRPGELVEALLGEDPGRLTVVREDLLIQRDCQRLSPLSPPIEAAAGDHAQGDPVQLG